MGKWELVSQTMMMSLVALVIVAAILGAEARSPNIIGGGLSSKGRWPHQVSLQQRNYGRFAHSCGGSILNAHWILVAAHCVMFDGNPSLYRVRLGMYKLSPTDYEQELGIEKIVVHPGWDMNVPGLPHDMTLLKVAGTIDLSNPFISTIPLGVPSETYAGNPDCWISGWGRWDRNLQTPSNNLLEAHVPVLTNQVCKEKYGWFGLYMPLTSNHICMDSPPQKDIHACHGDS